MTDVCGGSLDEDLACLLTELPSIDHKSFETAAPFLPSTFSGRSRNFSDSSVVGMHAGRVFSFSNLRTRV